MKKLKCLIAEDDFIDRKQMYICLSEYGLFFLKFDVSIATVFEIWDKPSNLISVNPDAPSKYEVNNGKDISFLYKNNSFWLS